MHFHINSFEGLYNRNWKGELVPGIALSHEIKNNGLTYIFKIRKNVKFHNGDPLTAEDVKFSYDRVRNPNTKCPWASWWQNMDKVEVLDTYTVAFYWKSPSAAFINQTTWLNAGAIVPKEYIKKVGDDGFSKHPIGTGPYKFISYTPGQNLVMESFLDYWGEVPEIKTIEFKFIPELGSRIAALKTGEIDIMQQLPPFEAESIKLTPGLDVVRAPNGEIFFYTLDSIDQPQFKDLKVRQAFNYAVNKANIAEKLFRGYVSVANSYVAPSLTGYDKTCPGYPYDPEKAKKLLEEANYKYDTPIVINIARGRWTMNEEAALAISSDLVAVGVNARVKFMEYSDWVSRLRPKKLADMTNMNRSNSAWDAEGSLKVSLKSGGSYVYWQNSPELDSMIDKLSTIYDPAARADQFKKIFWKTYEEAPVVFLWEFHDSWGKSSKIAWEMGPGERWAHFEQLRFK
jgi:peptide/nickel transport system substrate-binding protein